MKSVPYIYMYEYNENKKGSFFSISSDEWTDMLFNLFKFSINSAFVFLYFNEVLLDIKAYDQNECKKVLDKYGIYTTVCKCIVDFLSKYF